ncbi:autotransporter assembly complex family protein [Pseudidiomarina sp.]|uniref:autotransporter assembly complex protein TamA n=1 Tax=Pseudidiomarina sp. TaxID=2081707 RepID=UPI00299D6CC2|nr:autotransporter assembly complex family protein [Pseudidiomarina sp.]MDX1706229.1 autotransporter assembly complex family protein [Pseudidiomarina sp.]
MVRLGTVGGWLLVSQLILHIPASFAQESEERQRAPEDAKVKVTIEGVDGELEDNVRGYLSIMELDGKAAPARFRLRFLQQRGEEQIREALAPFGYYKPTIESSLELTGSNWEVYYSIAPGEPVRLDQIDIRILGDGKDDPKFQKILTDYGLTSGNILRHSAYETLKTRLRNLATERGYYNARFTEQTVQVELTDLSADVTLYYDTSVRYSFGETTFCCSELNNDFLHRFLNYEEGDAFQTRELLDLQVALSGSQYFSSIEVAPDWQNRGDSTVPITVDIKPNERDRYQFGLGYGTDTGARATVGFDRRWVNAKGHKLNSILRLSQVQNTGFVSYIIPGNDPVTDQYSLTGEITDRSYQEQRSTLYRFTARDTRHFNNWQRTYQLGWQREDFAFGDQPTRSSNFLIPSVEVSLVESTSLGDNRNLVEDGYRISAYVQGASSSVLSETSFVSAQLSAKWVHSYTDKFRMLLRGELGGMAVSDFSVLSPSLRFFAGGDYSVRGYEFEQLGPRNEEGVVIGGRYLATGSVEFDYRVAESWRLAVFSDFGNSFMDWPVTIKQSYGIGVRWISPIGPVRFDVAQAVDEPGNPWRIHLTLGPDL